MTPLQYIIIGIWVFLGLSFLYAIGEQLDGGFKLIFGLLGVVAVYGAAGALIWYTIKALLGN